MKRKFGDYFVGLDIGTNSIGYAVTDSNYKLLKFNGKVMWGIRLFEEGKTAEERRIFRTARRRQERKVQRIKLLQELFAQEITKVDPGFYQRLEDSKFWSDDKTEEQSNTLFNDENYNDQDYHNDYPTVYHLRKAFLDHEKELDVRFLYLAVHHILKKRGHFLFEGNSGEAIIPFEELFHNLQQYCKEEMELQIEAKELEDIELALKDNNQTITAKKSRLKKLFQAKTKQEIGIVGLMAGATVKLAELFDDPDLADAEIKSVTFKGTNFEDNEAEIENILDDRMELLHLIKSIYDWAILSNVLNGEKYLSYAKVDLYEEHKKDLQTLKSMIKEYCPEYYKDVFKKTDVKNNYVSYIGTSNGEAASKKCNQEELCKYLEKILGKFEFVTEEENTIIEKIKARTLLPKQVSTDNSVVPYQLNRQELKDILDYASSYLEFLNQKDESGYTVAEKVMKIMEFRIPYYVGPLNSAHKKNGGNAWIVRKPDIPIRPWNFDEVVDVEKSAEEFIRKMTNKCTYLFGADVLPKNSLLYSEFTLLNELNNVKLNGEPIPNDIKQRAITELFQVRKKVRMKTFKNWLTNDLGIDANTEVSGIDGDFKGSLASYIDFKGIIGDKIHDKELVERMILWIVLFGDDKKLLMKKMEKECKEQLSEEEIKRICRLRYTGWGRLSKEFLMDIYTPDKETGEAINIISMLRKSNENLMQLLSNKYMYLEAIDQYNQKQTSSQEDFSIEILDELYLSPAIRRSVWQVLKIIREIVKVTGREPKRIFIEMARGGEKNKKRTVSRKNRLIELYEKCKDEQRQWIDEIDNKNENDFRSDKLYLYYTQMGRCMYSGEPINIDQLSNKNVYDIDHIYPQSKVKDDSLDNRVLVKRTYNDEKKNIYPINSEWQQKQKGFWYELLRKGFISKKKYERLTRKTPFTNDELADFISRQVVETRQSTKAVANLLKNMYKGSEIVYVKAGNVSDFRKDNNMIKVREVNDYHHAKDAYLNIVVGNVYHVKFTQNPIRFLKSQDAKNYSMNKIFNYNVERGGEVAWIADHEKSLKHVKKIMSKNNILFTRYAREDKSEFFKKIKKAKEINEDAMPFKTSDLRLWKLKKYGGYSTIKTGYFFLVSHGIKDKKVRTIEYVPVYFARQFEESEEVRINYCKDKLKLNNPEVLLSKIKLDTLFEINGIRLHITGRHDKNRLKMKNANQLIIGYEQELYLKKIGKYIKRRNDEVSSLITIYDKITKDNDLEMYNFLMSKMSNNIYRKVYSNELKKLECKRDDFTKKGAEEQSVIIFEILKIFKCNNVYGKLNLLNMGEKNGQIVINKNISKLDSCKIINQSITGLFENEVDLLKL